MKSTISSESYNAVRASLCPLHTSDHRNVFKATWESTGILEMFGRNRVIAFRRIGKFVKCDNPEMDFRGEEAALGARDSHMLEWHEREIEKKTQKKVRSVKERMELPDVRLFLWTWSFWEKRLVSRRKMWNNATRVHLINGKYWVRGNS